MAEVEAEAESGPEMAMAGMEMPVSTVTVVRMEVARRMMPVAETRMVAEPVMTASVRMTVAMEMAMAVEIAVPVMSGARVEMADAVQAGVVALARLDRGRAAEHQ